MNDP
jgi:hypothetical protein